MQKQDTRIEIKFQNNFEKEVVGRFDGGSITSDAGGLLLGVGILKFEWLRKSRIFGESPRPKKSNAGLFVFIYSDNLTTGY